MTTKKTIKKIVEFVADILFPKQCVCCKTEGSFLCPECLAAIKLKEAVGCPACKARSQFGEYCKGCGQEELAGLLAIADYENYFLQEAIKAYKYARLPELAQSFASLYAESRPLSSLLQNYRGALLVPIPLHRRRKNWRGFNQAELLAREISKLAPASRVADEVLIRRRYTASQVEVKSADKRRENIKGAFAVKEWGAVRGQRVILVDDVATTMSTLSEAARELKKAGAKEVFGVVLARGQHLTNN